jgi:hypothetical protein
MFFVNELLRNIEESAEAAGRFGANLEETPIENRKIFTITEGNFAYGSNDEEKQKEADKRKECYKAMIEMLNEDEKYVTAATEDRELKSLRRLLREVWKKHEDKLRVNNYSAKEMATTKKKEDEYKGKEFYKNKDNIWGVGINLDEDTKHDWDPEEEEIKIEKENEKEKEMKVGWRVAYHTIFHEFFHNIDHAANPQDDKYFAAAYRGNEFGKTIEMEIYELRDEEEDKSKKASEKRLNKLTYHTAKRKKAALYDLIGGVLNRGRYGCNPPNSEFYNKGKDGKAKKCEVRFLCDFILSRADSRFLDCDSRKNCKPNDCGYGNLDVEDGYRCYYGNHSSCYQGSNSNKDCNICGKYKRKKCFPAGNKCRYICGRMEKCDYKNECRLETCDWCNKIFGHGVNYWKEKPKKNFPSSPEFLECLAAEGFAHFAAEAIVNPEAYKKIRECLTDSEKIFREIIREMLREELERFYRLWA